MSGMYVLVERGNVVRYFMKDDAVQGNSAELAGFLTEKCHLAMEQITVGWEVRDGTDIRSKIYI